MVLLYNLFLLFYRLGAYVASINSEKARFFVKGRKDWKEKLTMDLAEPKDRIWVHVASLGEYDQALPVLELFHEKYPNFEIVLTFFSPSGYEYAKFPEFLSNNYYLPLDSKSNASYFLDQVNPKLILFVKYDIWYHYLVEAKKRAIPSILFSALFRENQIYFKFYGGLMRKALRSFSKIYTQNSASKNLLDGIGIEASVSGDTRFDRVRNRMMNNTVHPYIEEFSKGEKIFVVGSSWMDDLEEIVDVLNKQTDFKLIIAPHNIGEDEIQRIIKVLDKTFVRFSEIDESSAFTKKEVLIIDNIGMLASVYSVGELAYVGGAFHGSLHNILEPAVFGLPVIFGPNFDKFPEAQGMIEAGAASSISDTMDFEKIFKSLSKEDNRKIAGDNASRFVADHIGSSQKIISGVETLLNAEKI